MKIHLTVACSDGETRIFQYHDIDFALREVKSILARGHHSVTIQYIRSVEEV